MSLNIQNFTVLYVEDDKDTIDRIQEILSPRVKELYLAKDGKEGFEMFKEKMPDIIITDIHMPYINGIDMTKMIKEIKDDQPIVILTAFNENSLLHQSVELGVDAYITKPVSELEKLLGPIEKVATRLQGIVDKKRVQHLLEVQGKTAAIGEMIGNIAHQWRQPLSVISTIASGISFQKGMNVFDDEQLIPKMDDIVLQTQYLSKTIDDFRDFLKSDTSVKNEINVKKTIFKIRDLIKASMTENNITCIDELEDCYVKLNENQLMQALINICNNAKDALINIKNEEERYFFIKLTQQNNNCLIVIKDSGGGIREDVIDKVYEPYFTTKHPSIGTGIGLYMTFQIITKTFHGRIDVKNVQYEHDGKILKGAEFTITLPISV